MQTLSGVCLLTHSVRQLAEFYRQVLQREPTEESDEYVAFSASSSIVLSIYSLQAMQNWAPAFFNDQLAGRCSLEFDVEDVDLEHQRLVSLGAQIVRPPTTYPWGLRAVWFNDPEGNLITFHALAQKEE